MPRFLSSSLLAQQSKERRIENQGGKPGGRPGGTIHSISNVRRMHTQSSHRRIHGQVPLAQGEGPQARGDSGRGLCLSWGEGELSSWKSLTLGQVHSTSTEGPKWGMRRLRGLCDLEVPPETQINTLQILSTSVPLRENTKWGWTLTIKSPIENTDRPAQFQVKQ